MDFFEALSWVKDLGLENVVIEGDSKIVADRFSLILWGSVDRRILRQNPTYSVNFVRRNANKMTHAFVRASRNFGSSYC